MIEKHGKTFASMAELRRFEAARPSATPQSRSRAALPENIRRTLEESNLPIEVATAIADLCDAAQSESERRCKTEQDCIDQPWCRILGQCRRQQSGEEK